MARRALVGLAKVGSLLLASCLSAETIDSWLEAGVPTRPAAPRAWKNDLAPLPPRSLDSLLGPIRARNVFDHGEPVPEEGGSGEVTDATPTACALPVRVLSSLVSPDDPAVAFVTFLDTQESPPRVHVLEVGEEIEGARLVAVREENSADGLETVPIAVLRDGTGLQVCRPTEGERSAPGPATSAASGIRKVGEGAYLVERSLVEATLGSGMETLVRQVRVAPFFSGGRAIGFRLEWIDPSSALAALGLAAGDVIEKVNGYDVSTLGAAATAFAMLKNEPDISVEVSRGGQEQKLTYSIR